MRVVVVVTSAHRFTSLDLDGGACRATRIFPHRPTVVPQAVEVTGEPGEHAVRAEPLEMKQWGCTPSSRVEVGSHEHLVVKAENGVVEGSVLEAELGAGTVQKRSELVQAALDASDESNGLLLLLVATLDVFGVRVRHDDSHLA